MQAFDGHIDIIYTALNRYQFCLKFLKYCSESYPVVSLPIRVLMITLCILIFVYYNVCFYSFCFAVIPIINKTY